MNKYLSDDAKHILFLTISNEDSELEFVEQKPSGYIVIKLYKEDGDIITIANAVSKREIARWRDAFKELTQKRYLEQASTYVFNVTTKGYQYFDSLTESKKAQTTQTEQLVIDNTKTDKKEYDFFICHASEDKEYVNSLVQCLKKRKAKVWYDDDILTIGDSIRKTIETGLKESQFGIIVISKYFHNKQWPERELNVLLYKNNVLPIWYDVDKAYIEKHFPFLVDIYAYQTNSKNIDSISEELMKKIS